MQGTHTASNTDAPRTSRFRIGLAWVVGVLAVLLTLFLGWSVIDALTGDYVGGEIDFVRAIVVAVAVFATLAWIGAVALWKSGRDRSRHSRLLNTGLLMTLAGAAGVQALSTTPLWVGALAVFMIGLAMAAIGAARM